MLLRAPQGHGPGPGHSAPHTEGSQSRPPWGLDRIDNRIGRRCSASTTFMLLGNGAGGVPLHSPGYDFDDDALEVGVRYYVNLVRLFTDQG
ncbi:hypothetical protein [Dactylosporangium sp. NPDC049140]|uniref:hypothetical protein n=1 Tax=Dactylosporangium sp. NPDC049140 TaxID=3155647 RepID=UPI0033D1AE07